MTIGDISVWEVVIQILYLVLYQLQNILYLLIHPEINTSNNFGLTNLKNLNDTITKTLTLNHPKLETVASQ